MNTKLTKIYRTAHDAIEQLATAPGSQPSDRALLLAKLRNRISDQIVGLSADAERRLGANPVNQRSGD